MKFLFILTMLVAQTCLWGQDYMGAITQAQDLDNANKPIEALAAYQKALEIDAIDGEDWYNAARLAAKTGHKTWAFQYLHRATQQCFTDIDHLKSHPSFLPLQSDRRWKPLLHAMQQKLNQTDTVLRQQLIDIQQIDQNGHIHVREINRKYGYDSDSAKIAIQQLQHQDSLNLIQVTTILDKYGWLGADQIGAWATQGLYLVIQHSNLPVRKKYLPLFQATVQRKQAHKANLAHLEDRIAVEEGRRQEYGTQAYRDSITLRLHLYPIAEPKSVDKRRAKMGLEPLSVYLKASGIEE